MNIKVGSHGMRAGATAYVRELPTKSRKVVAEPKVAEPEPAEEQPAIKPEKSKRAPRKKKPVILDTLPE